MQLRIIVTRGKYNKRELAATVLSVDGHLCIGRWVYNTFETLAPEWVTPKFHPTHDNGLLIVIKGDHCGKYVRRIHHRYEDKKVVVILAVVNRVAGVMDTLTGEQLELDASHLCLCEEPKTDKMLNSSLMDTFWEEAHSKVSKVTLS
jgi:hypothetical protein